MKLPRHLAAKLPPGRGVNLAALGLGDTEAAFQAAVIALARRNGWDVFHVPDSRLVTAVGYPDLSCKRGLRVVVAELKKRGEQPRADQWGWLHAFAACGVEAKFWTPDDWPEIQEVLR